MYKFNPYPQQLIKVNGIEGARAYQIGAGSQAALFDSNNDIFYIKSNDACGFPTIRVFKFEEVQPETREFVSREEMEEFVKRYLSKQQPAATAEPTASDKSIFAE